MSDDKGVMTELVRTQRDSYRWWREDNENAVPEHVPALHETAKEQIAAMRAKGFTSGQILDNIRMTDADPEDGVAYRGWWEALDGEEPVTDNGKPVTECFTGREEKLLGALKDLIRELAEGVRLDVRKHYSLMVADSVARKLVFELTGGHIDARWRPAK